MEQWNRLESPEINSHIYGQLIFNSVPGPFNGERIDFQTNGTEKTGYPQE